MAALSTQSIVNAGTAPTMGPKALSDTAEVGSGRNTVLIVRNEDAEAKVLTVVAPGNTNYGAALPDPTFSLADGSSTPTEVWIPLRREYVDNDVAGYGRCTVTISTGTATGVTCAVVRVG